MDNAFDILSERGFVEDSTDEKSLRAIFQNSEIVAYVGYDPSGKSLHVGNLLTLMALRHLARCGNKIIAVIGGGTALVGDPSGKNEMRSMLSRDEIRANFERIKKQVVNFLASEKNADLTVVDNGEWLENLNYLEFLRDIGKHFSVNRMLAAESYKIRMEKGLSFLEFNYQILQAYDYLMLNRRYGCNLQMGGSDQWGNILAGTDLIRRVDGAEAHALTFPLLTTASGAKMGKTEKGAVWLDPEMLSPFDFFQYWRNMDDKDVVRMLKFYTFLSLDEINTAQKAQDSEINIWKERLAFEVTSIVHGPEEAQKALDAAKKLFSEGATNSEDIPTVEIGVRDIDNGLYITTLAAQLGLVKSRSEANRLIKQGGLYINNNPVHDTEEKISQNHFEGQNSEKAFIRVGKKKFGCVKLRE